MSRPVGLRDLAATIFDLAGLEGEVPFPGRSLARTWHETHGAAAGEDTVLTEARGRVWLSASKPVSRGDMRSLLSGGLHYIRYGDGAEELFEPQEDPWEIGDLSNGPDMRAVVDRFREMLGTFPPYEHGPRPAVDPRRRAAPGVSP